MATPAPKTIKELEQVSDYIGALAIDIHTKVIGQSIILVAIQLVMLRESFETMGYGDGFPTKNVG